MSVGSADRLRCFCPKCIDFHTHFLQREVFFECQPHSVSSCFGRDSWPLDMPVMQRMFSPEMQIEDMDRRGIDINVLTSADVMQSRAWAEPEEEYRMTAIVNEECARWVDAHPTRFLGTAVLPLGDMRRALSTAEWALSANLKVIQLPANFRGDYLGHARFIDLFAMIEAHDLVVFMHPEGAPDMWFQNYAMWNSIGQSIEEVKVMSSLIYEGMMDRFPRLKLIMAHGGGYMPHYMGRLDRNFTDKPYSAKNLTKKPSEYLRDFYYDSCVYDPRTLELLIERVGIDRVVLGGDYPAAELDPLDLLDQADIADADRAKIAGGTALALLGMV